MLELIVLIVSGSLNFLLGLLVYRKNPNGDTNRFFLLMTWTFVVWSTVNYFSLHPVFFAQLTWIRLVLFFAAFLCLSVYLTLMAYPSPKLHGSMAWHKVAAAATGLVMILTLTPFVFSQLTSGPDGTASPVAAPGIAAFMALVISLLGTGIWHTVTRYRGAKGRERQQLKYLLIGIIGSFGLIISANLLVVVFFHSSKLIPYAASFTLVFSISTAYAIVRHRLLDVRAVVARSVAYILLLITLGGVYAALVFAASAVFIDKASPASVLQNLLYVGLATVLAFTFQPLRLFFESATDRVFFRNRYDSQIVLASLSNLLVAEFDLDHLLKGSLEQICNDLSIGFGQFIIFNDGKVYRSAQYGTAHLSMIEVSQLAHLSKPIIVADELEGGERKAILEEHGLRLSALLRTRDEIVGYLLLGDKLSGDIYSSQDIEVIGIMAKELAVAISNAKAYAEIQAFAVTLQERVTHATSRLRVVNRHLKELDQAKDEFLSLASHQLRTPLTTIKGYLSMVLEGDAGKLNKEQRRFTEYAFDGSERMVRLITDLLDVSRMSAGRFVIQPSVTDMNEVMRSEIQQLQSHAATKNLKLTLEAPSTPLPPLLLDENKTRQVIMNFVDNAIYYTEKGSVTVVLSSSAGKFRVEVRDTGIGVPKEAQKHLFSKFYRATNAQKSRPDGTGLGLFLAKRVIEDQGGTIIFSSEEGKGSIFGFELPIVKATEASKMVKPIVTEAKVAVKA